MTSPGNRGATGNTSALREVIGAQIVGVRYLVSEGMGWPGGRADGFVHEVDHGVEITLSGDRVLVLRWEMLGENEFLDPSLHLLPREQVSDSMIDAIDVSATPEWAPLIGHTISSVRASWHISNTGCPKSIWAVRFDTAENSSFVIALGEIRDGVPAYLPDAVLVFFDRDDAEAYKTGGSATSAWDGAAVEG